MSEDASKKKTRAYHSPRRQEQATITRDRIVTAALKQLQEKGYADMTLESIAREAGVAPQTVYAVCGSKKGVLGAILENSVESWKYDKYRDMIMEVKTGEERVKAMGHFLSLLLENSSPGFQIMRGLGVVSPELADVEVDNEMVIYEKNQKQIQRMAEDGLLRPDLDVETATDMAWAVSAPGVHRRLTKLRGWSPERYSAFMARVLGFLLLEPGAEIPDAALTFIPKQSPEPGVNPQKGKEEGTESAKPTKPAAPPAAPSGRRRAGVKDSAE